VAIPDELESVETFQFLELRPETARDVFNYFVQRKVEFPDWATTLGAAIDHVESIEGDAYSETDDWRGIMNAIGLTTNFQNRVMDPEYTRMRLTGTAKFWAVEMMRMRYEFLQSLDNLITTQGRRVNREASHSGNFKSGPPQPVPKRGSSKGDPVVGIFSTAGPSTATAEVDWPLAEINGHSTFYKGGPLATLKRIYLNDNPLNLGIGQILCSPPTDFTGETMALYLTKQEQVAHQYAKWAKRIVDGKVVPVGLLAIAIPDNLLTSITQVVGEEWRRLVWNSRRQLFGDVGLNHLREYQWLTGPLCRQCPDKVRRLNNPAELEVWKLDTGEAASQHYTASASMYTMLQNACVGKVWIKEI